MAAQPSPRSDSGDVGAPRWDFFVSYASPDRPWGEWLAWQLEEAGHSVLVAARDEVPGDHLGVTADAGLAHADRMIAVITQEYQRPGPHRLALSAALDGHGHHRRPTLVPVRVEQCDLHDRLSGMNLIELAGLAPDAARRRLLEQIGRTGGRRGVSLTEPAHPGARPPGRPRPAAAPRFPAASSSAAAEGWAARLVELSDGLAREVEQRWSDAAKELHAHNLLPVRWAPAPVELFDDWTVLRDRASHAGAGWPTPAPEGWAVGPQALEGGPDNLLDVVRSVPTRRLVVLGEAGAGKSTLLLRVALDQLRRRRDEGGGVVPVLLHLGSWDPKRSFAAWLREQLAGHRCVRAAMAVDPAVPADLLRSGLFLLLLDGFDEIAGDPGDAMAGLGADLEPAQQTVVASRLDRYRQGAAVTRLTATAGVLLQPLSTQDALRHLRESAGAGERAGPADHQGPDRWEEVLGALEASPVPAPLTALTIPLWLTLAQRIYSGRRDADNPPPHPNELLRQPDRTALEGYLLDRFIDARYGPDPTDARRWLAFLARQVELGGHGLDVAWWSLPGAVRPGPARSALAAAAAALVGLGALSALLSGLAITVLARRNTPTLLNLLRWPGILLLLGTCVWWAVVSTSVFSELGGYATWGRRLPERGVRRSRQPGRPRDRILPAFVVYLLPISYVAASPTLRKGYGIADAAVTFAVIGAGITWAWWRLHDVNAGPPPGTPVDSPTASLAADRRVFLRLAAEFGAAVTLGVWAWFSALYFYVWPQRPLVVLGTGLVVGLVVGPPCALAGAAAKTAWGPYTLTRHWLALRRQLPRDLAGFLAAAHDPHEAGVLRRIGPVYQFRHVELQRRLAGSAQSPQLTRLVAELRARLLARLPVDDALAVHCQPVDIDLAEPWPTTGPLRVGQGGDTTVRHALARATVPRLVVLGSQGSGRTTALTRLALELLDCRRPGGPVPMPLSPCSWEPQRQRFADWLEYEIRRRHTTLAVASAQVTGARALVDSRKVIPFLDGLEDLEPACRAAAINGINEWLAADGGLVLGADRACLGEIPAPTRAERPVRLEGAHAVELRPIPAVTAARYLACWPTGGARPPVPAGDLLTTAGQWSPVLSKVVLVPDSPLAAAFSAPLVVSLAAAVYGRGPDPRPGADRPGGEDRPGPEELDDVARFPTADSIRQHLLAQYLRSLLEDRSGDAPAGTHLPAGPGDPAALAFVATELARRRDRDGLAWWELTTLAPRRLAAGPAAVLGAAIVLPLEFLTGPWMASGLAVVSAAVYYVLTLRIEQGHTGPARIPALRLFGRPGWSGTALRRSPQARVAITAVAVPAALVGLVNGGSVGAIVAGTGAACIGVAVAGLRLRPPAPGAPSGPGVLLRRTRWYATVVFPPFAIAVMLVAVIGLALAVLHAVPTSGWWWLRALVGSAGAGLSLTFAVAAWWRLVAANRWLRRHHGLPADLVGVLERACARGILRQSGDVWELCHPALLPHLVGVGRWLPYVRKRRPAVPRRKLTDQSARRKSYRSSSKTL